MLLRFHAVFSEVSMKFGRNSTTEKSVIKSTACEKAVMSLTAVVGYIVLHL
jgi:hypothetical protein